MYLGVLFFFSPIGSKIDNNRFNNIYSNIFTDINVIQSKITKHQCLFFFLTYSQLAPTSLALKGLMLETYCHFPHHHQDFWIVEDLMV